MPAIFWWLNFCLINFHFAGSYEIWMAEMAYRDVYIVKIQPLQHSCYFTNNFIFVEDVHSLG